MLMRPAAEHHNSHHPKSPLWGSPGAGAGWSEPPTLVRGTSKVVQPRCKTLTCQRPDQVLARCEVKAGRNCSPRKNPKIISGHGRYSPVGHHDRAGRRRALNVGNPQHYNNSSDNFRAKVRPLVPEICQIRPHFSPVSGLGGLYRRSGSRRK